MGVTIHYRGTLADLSRVEDFEDRVIDLALALGGNVRLWRSADDSDPSRMVRGLFVDLAPGQETTSLLIAPEGWFIGLIEIEDAEKGLVTEPPWCSVKTQFGPIEGHVALVELLDAVKKEFVPNLKVMDEGEYWETRNLARLRQKHEFVGQAINALADALEKDRLSPEAREDPEILATRIERLARKVHSTISRPAEHPPVQFPEDDAGAPPDPDENEDRWDALYNENRRKQERMERVMEEQMLRGEDAHDAFEAAINDVVPPMDWVEDDDEVSEGRREVLDMLEELNEASRTAADEDEAEPWQESLPEAVRGDAAAEDDQFGRMQRHPLQQQATNLLIAFDKATRNTDQRSPTVGLLIRNAMEVTGGLAQVLPLPPPYEIDGMTAGHSLVQLKRALRGAAFVRGALFLMRGEKLLDDAVSHEFLDETDAISKQIVELIRTVREAGR